MSRKLTTIIVISFVTVLAVVAAVVSLVSYRIFFDFTSQEISGTRLALLNENADKMSSISNDISEAGLYLAANETIIDIFSGPVIDDFDAVTEQRELRNQLYVMAVLKPDIHSLEIYTDRYLGYPIIIDNIMPIAELEKLSWFTIFDNMDSGWVPWEENGQRMVSYLHRLVDYRGMKVGYVKVNILEEKFFADMTVEEGSEPGSELMMLIDAGGRVLARTPAMDDEALFAQLAVESEEGPYHLLGEEYMPLRNHHQLFIHNNERYLLLISEPNYERWRYMQLVPVDPLYAETKKLGWIVLMVGVLVLLLSIPLVYWLGKRIILLPIRKIIKGIKQVERGNFNVHIEPLRVEEFDHLANHFNHMTRELEDSIKQIEKEHFARRDAEMKMLQMQIMPHFLYNTLDIIHWKAMDHKAEDISLMVYSLSKMFRIGLSSGRNFIRLRDELEHVKCFIDIQKARMAGRKINYEADVPAYLKDYFVPKIILQPFIENSMKHGYEGKEGEVWIGIKVMQDAEEGRGHGDLLITIADEGEGFPDHWDIEQTSGIGMKNVQERIQMYCGSPYGIEVRNRASGGAEVVIRLPALRTPEEVDKCLASNSERFDGM